jgi:hypothetical protein
MFDLIERSPKQRRTKSISIVEEKLSNVPPALNIAFGVTF